VIELLISDKANFQLKVKNRKDEHIKLLEDLNFVYDLKVVDDWINLSISNDNDLPMLFNYLKDYSVSNFNQIEPDLSAIFKKLMQ